MTINSLVRSPWLLARTCHSAGRSGPRKFDFRPRLPPFHPRPQGRRPHGRFTGRRQTAERSPSTSYGRRWSGMRL